MPPWLRELDSIRISDIAGKQWIRQAIATPDGSLMYLVCIAGAKSSLLECRLEAATQTWSVQPMQTGANQPLCMVMGAALYGCALLLATDYVNHHVVVFTDGKADGEPLSADKMRQPCAIDTDGHRAFVAASGTIYEFDLQRRQCVASWPTATTGSAAFACDHGIALHDDRLFVVDRNGGSIHVFHCQGEHLFSFGSPGFGAGLLYQPYGVCVTRGHVLISEHGGKCVQIFTLDGKPMGQLCPDPDGCGTLAHLSSDESSGRVLVADWDQHCVRQLQLLDGVSRTLSRASSRTNSASSSTFSS